MMITLIAIGLIIGTAFLVKNSKSKPSIMNYIIVLIAGIITLLFEPVIFTLLDYKDGGGAIQIASTIFGLYFIGWAIYKMIKFKKNDIK